MSILLKHWVTGAASGGINWSSYWTALNAAMTNKPSQAYSMAANTFIEALVDGGVWAKLDRLFVFAAETNDGGEALLDWIHPTGTGALIVGSPAFTSCVGIKGDQSVNNYINSRYNPISVNANYQQNSASIGAWFHTSNVGDSPVDVELDIKDAAVGGGKSYVASAYAGSTIRTPINSNYSSVAVAGVLGSDKMLTAVRESSTVIRRYIDKVGSADISDNSVVPYNNSFVFLHNTNAELSMVFFGSALSGTDITTLYDAWDTFFFFVNP